MKAYTKIYTNYISRGLQIRVEEHPDFESKIDDDPIALLEVIKELMHKPVRAQHHLVSMTNNLQRWLTAKQNDDEPLLEYMKQHKQLMDVVKLQFRMGILRENIKCKPEYTAAKAKKSKEEKKKLLDDGFDEWNAYLLLQGADKLKYGTLMMGFVNQFSLGNNQYPKSVTLAIDALSNHKFDQKYWDNKKKNQSTNKNRNGGRQGRNENDEGTNTASFAQGQQS